MRILAHAGMNGKVALSLLKPLSEALKTWSSIDVSSEDLFSCSSRRLQSALFAVAFKRSVPISQRMVALKAYSTCTSSIDPEFAHLLIQELNDELSSLWVNELLQACILLCLKIPGALSAFQTQEFVEGLQAVHHLSPYKATFLLIRLVNSGLCRYIDVDLLRHAQEEVPSGPIRTNLCVLLGYVAWYRKSTDSSPLKDLGPAMVKTASNFLLSDLGKALSRILACERSPLVLPALGFLAENSPEVREYLEESGTFSRIASEEISAAETSPGGNYLRINYFLGRVLPASDRFKRAVAETDYVEKAFSRMEKALESEVFTAETVSFAEILKVLARLPEVAASRLSTYKITNFLEKVAKTLHAREEAFSYGETRTFASEYFLLLGNLVMHCPHWKETAVKTLLGESLKYLSLEACRVSVLKFLRSLVFEASPGVSLHFVSAVDLDSLEGFSGGVQEKGLFLSILKNLLCTRWDFESPPELIRWVLEYAKTLPERALSRGISPVEASPLCESMLYALANAAVVSPGVAVHEFGLQTALLLFRFSPEKTVFSAFLAYLVNFSGIPAIRREKRACTFSEMPVSLTSEVVVLLKQALGQDADTDVQIRALLPRIRLD
ncbi:uncharacterized protein NEMAJ01_2280 [Nematocida major]|uniref:uncharacterized protein n=1 Tax=Nematocida major TaxID=1912982 RepID=UPI002007D56B|nr:uncharacterized protein NEMAJ01_2280 [Nematocida major]KAH9387384.1 hypothetical protein NEMAJ01_2280 [Nematocida major]